IRTLCGFPSKFSLLFIHFLCLLASLTVEMLAASLIKSLQQDK
ncbi:Uncharacterized protein APZ42_004873, partial [Daphnia magna]